MTAGLVGLCFDANDPRRLAQFWAGVLGWQTADSPPKGTALLPSDEAGFGIRFVLTQEQKSGPNHMHFELTSTSLEVQQQTVQRALALGAMHIDVGQRPKEGHVVLADPEGNEFCVIEPGNNFLADCGFLGGLSCDGSREVGCFWSEALGWPLVWDQDEETAIRSPRGGPKIAWGGPPLVPRTRRNRLRFDLAPFSDAAWQAEVARLLSLGATAVDVQGEVIPVGPHSGVEMQDPDGNEFCVLTSRSPLA